VQEFLLIYLDDVILLGCSFEDMVTNLKRVYDRLLAAGLKIKAKKRIGDDTSRFLSSSNVD
jgi:hypothetical protein